MICRHRDAIALRQMHDDQSPIYNLFGDACVYFNEKERDQAVAYYYYFKSIQHLLNICDKQFDDYMLEHVLPFKSDCDELEKRIDKSSGTFLKEQRIPIEATLITEKTQGLLLKSSDDDHDYLINASDNKLVFIDELSHNQQWQLKDTDAFISGYRKRIDHLGEDQGSISDEYLKDLKDLLTVHKRTSFNDINNEVSDSRRDHVESFKHKIDGYLLDFINKNDRFNYKYLSEILTPDDVKKHRSNIDFGIAFLEYLEAGSGDYLTDKKVASGDTNLSFIKSSLEVEESRRQSDLHLKEKDIIANYEPREDGTQSVAKSKFDIIDKEIDKQKETIRLCNFQLENWIDEDAERQLTARSRSVIAACSGLLASIIWLVITYWTMNPALKFFKKHDILSLSDVLGFRKFQWSIAGILLLIGLIVGFIIVYKVVRKRKDAEAALQKAKNRKVQQMIDCMNDMKALVERRYKYLLAFHGLKTINELLDYVKWRKEDLIIFRKTLFQMMVRYKLDSITEKRTMSNDFNTIELNDQDVRRILFGNEEEEEKEENREVPYCFAGGMTLSDTFENFKKKKVKFETTRFSLENTTTTDFDQETVEKEVIPARKEDEGAGIVYTPLSADSILPKTDDVRMDDVHQGSCGDCYFMATLASIARMNPEYIIGKNGLVEEIGDEHKFFRLKFYDKDGNRVNVDIDNKFWNKNGKPYYAGIGKIVDTEGGSAYDPWVMAVEKAWAKANNEGYDGIEGTRADGKELVRKVEYSFAVTGKSAFYCMIQNVLDRDRLLKMMQKHVQQDHLPITLYSAQRDDATFDNKDPFIVPGHAYALKSANDDGTFDIFNPWNLHDADEEVHGKHYEKVSIDFIKDNFDVVVFFGIKEADFAKFERDLTHGANEQEVIQVLEAVLKQGFSKLTLDKHSLDVLMTEEVMESTFSNANYLFSRNRVKDERGVNKDDRHLLYLEGERTSETANNKMLNYLEGLGQLSIQPIILRDDDKPAITILRISPPYVLSNFHDVK